MLKSSKELFSTSTAGGVMPITKVSGENIKQGTVGMLQEKFTNSIGINIQILIGQLVQMILYK